jgi:hypothetical protein
MTIRFWFAAIFSAALATLAAIEFTASFLVPPWPARALQSTPPLTGPAFNSWGIHDVEHNVAKSSVGRFRAVFVGDSFVEGSFDQLSLPMAVGNQATQHGVKGLEPVSLGVSGTGPRSYYYRVRDVALSLAPDALLIFFFSGNDFVQPGEGYDDRWIPSLVDESPGAAVLGNVMPRTNWLLINRLRMSEALRGNKPIPDENRTLDSIANGPPEQRIPRLVEHMRRYYYPEVSEERLSEIFSRGGVGFWKPFKKGGPEHEVLQGWLVNLMVAAEVQDYPLLSIRTPDDAAQHVSGQEIEATLSWLVALNRLATARKVPLKVFMIPTANVAPDFVEFWRPWPRYLGWYILSDVRHQRLVEALRHSAVPFVDLRNDLLAVRGAYRLTDAHWSTAGAQIATKRVYSELSTMVPR